jgi:hypothetical protein
MFKVEIKLGVTAINDFSFLNFNSQTTFITEKRHLFKNKFKGQTAKCFFFPFLVYLEGNVDY